MLALLSFRKESLGDVKSQGEGDVALSRLDRDGNKRQVHTEEVEKKVERK